MNASRDARAADIAELLPDLSEYELARAVELSYQWFVFSSPQDADAWTIATFVAKVRNGDGMSGASVRV